MDLSLLLLSFVNQARDLTALDTGVSSPPTLADNTVYKCELVNRPDSAFYIFRTTLMMVKSGLCVSTFGPRASMTDHHGKLLRSYMYCNQSPGSLQ